MNTTDVFSLAGVSADELRWSEEPWRHHPCHRTTTIGPLELARLAEVVGIGGHGEVIRDFSLLAGESQESPWVVSFPDELMSRICELGEADAGDVARRWSASCGSVAGATPDELERYLRSLGVFARHSDGPYALYIRLASE